MSVADESELTKIYTAQQIVSVMNRISKTLPDHRDEYELLGEYAYPDYDGLVGLYGFWKDNFNLIPNYSSPWDSFHFSSFCNLI